ncbi:hypothetical protein B0H10DRAFT_636311 [Mycena sp. CBHHK59/15]|nr:hypothetical protein B0H10DRAFT_636311 [Mycena sp. CBHHK59/15]
MAHTSAPLSSARHRRPRAVSRRRPLLSYVSNPGMWSHIPLSQLQPESLGQIVRYLIMEHGAYLLFIFLTLQRELKSDFYRRGNIPPLVTRSRAKSASSTAGSNAPVLPHSQSSQPTYPLNTSGYKGSGRTKGIKSSATGVPDGPRNTQRQLEVNQSTSRATREVPAAQFDQFLEFLASTTTVAYSQGEASSNPHTPINPKRKKKSVVIQSPPPQVPDINESETESEHAPKKKRLTKKEKGKGKAVGSDAESVPAIRGRLETCVKPPPQKQGKSLRAPASQDRSAEDPGLAPPPVPESFAASFKPQTSCSPETHLAEKKVLTVLSLPPKCEVTFNELQDQALKKLYESLLNLRKCILKSWSSDIGDGNMLLSNWPSQCPSINYQSLWNAINFVQKGRYINLSRIDPMIL